MLICTARCPTDFSERVAPVDLAGSFARSDGAEWFVDQVSCRPSMGVTVSPRPASRPESNH